MLSNVSRSWLKSVTLRDVNGFLAHPYQRAIFDLRELLKIQSHIVPNQKFQIHKITTDSEFKDAFNIVLNISLIFFHRWKKIIFEISRKTKIARR